ncbi:ATP-binding cassette domain-containing protein [Arthrobacter sp.]|uniref:ATP-binding cassette domain-containing protein n=1 Tax=Arthrobacter sp. TaxID=1667 RepID=UPI003A91CB72
MALTGPNGAGKSTLLRQLLSGAGPDGGISGTLHVDRVGYLPQQLAGLDDTLSAWTTSNARLRTSPLGPSATRWPGCCCAAPVSTARWEPSPEANGCASTCAACW